MKDLYVYGAGGMGREIFELVGKINEREQRWNIRGYIDDGKTGLTEEGNMIFGDMSYLESLSEDVDVVIGIADTKIKKSIVEKLENNSQISFPGIIHPDANISKNCTIKRGCIVTYGCTIATKAILNEFVFINTGSDVGHDTLIGKFTTIMPAVNISGCCQIGEGVLFGTKATVIPGKRIGKNSTIGAGAVVFRNVPESVTVLGNPGKVFKF
jgi:sugar O-acyltransferase (sialic acid O-acetyltransferase NeuD family)